MGIDIGGIIQEKVSVSFIILVVGLGFVGMGDIHRRKGCVWVCCCELLWWPNLWWSRIVSLLYFIHIISEVYFNNNNNIDFWVYFHIFKYILSLRSYFLNFNFFFIIIPNVVPVKLWLNFVMILNFRKCLFDIIDLCIGLEINKEVEK